jgi:hypothetical protein
MHRGGRGDARASCASLLGTPLAADMSLMFGLAGSNVPVPHTFVYITCLRYVAVAWAGEEGAGRYGPCTGGPVREIHSRAKVGPVQEVDNYTHCQTYSGV